MTDLIIKSQLKDPDVRALFADPEYSDMIAGLYHEFAEGAQRAGMEAVLRQEGVISMLQRFDILRTPMNQEAVVDMLNDARLRTIARARFDECLLRLAHLRARTGGDDVKAFITAVEGVGVSSGAAILEQLLREMQSRNMPLAKDPALGGGAKTIYPNRPFHRHGQVASVTVDPLSRSGGGSSSSSQERKGARGAPSRRTGAAAVTERLASRPASKLEPPPGGSPGVDMLTFEQLRRHVSALEQQLASADDRLRSAGLVPTRRAASTKLDGSMLVVDIEKHGQHARHVIDVAPAGMTTASEHESTLAHFVEMRAKIATLGARNAALEMARGAAEAEPKASTASSSKASSKSASPPRALPSALSPRDANALAELQAELKRVRERERDFCHQLKAKTKECDELERLLHDANALVAAVRQQRGSSALEHAKRLLHSDGRSGAPPPNSLGAHGGAPPSDSLGAHGGAPPSNSLGAQFGAQFGAQSLALHRGSSAATLAEGAPAVELEDSLAACLKENGQLRAQIAQLELLAGVRRGGISDVGLLEYAENMKVRPCMHTLTTAHRRILRMLEPKPLHAYAHHGASLFPTGAPSGRRQRRRERWRRPRRWPRRWPRQCAGMRRCGDRRCGVRQADRPAPRSHTGSPHGVVRLGARLLVTTRRRGIRCAWLMASDGLGWPRMASDDLFMTSDDLSMTSR